MRFLVCILVIVFILPSCRSQDELLGEKRERYKIWTRWKSKRMSYNPYLDRKGKDKPSSKMARENKSHVKKQQKEAKRQLRKSKRSIGKANKKRRRG